MEDVAEKEVLGVLLEVDVGDLDEAEAVEGRGQVGQEEGALDYLDLMPGPLVGIKGGGGDGSD